MKLKHLLLAPLFICFIVLLFSSCSQYDEMGLGNTGSGDPKVEGEKNIKYLDSLSIQNDNKTGDSSLLKNYPEVDSEGLGNTGSGDPKIN